MVEHSVIIEMLKAKGFSQRWIFWITYILSSTTSSVLLNGVAGKDFKCKREVRQGDPLSPLLFAVAADLLQSVVNEAYTQGALSTPFPSKQCVGSIHSKIGNQRGVNDCESQKLILKVHPKPKTK
jgi:hypothetical protein